MDISRVSAIALAILAAIFVIIAGKSCADDAVSQNRKRSSAASKQQVTAAFQVEDPTRKATEPPAPETVPEATQAMYEVVTNMLGDVIETIPITEAVEDNTDATTETKSILEAYDELHEGTTLPPQQEAVPVTTTTYIEPATNIVIHVG